MNEQEEFFSSKHKRLLNIATWAKHLAWVVLVAYFLLVAVQIAQLVSAKDDGNIFGPISQSLFTMLRDDPLQVFRRIVSMVVTLIVGFIYSLVLKGISLGLNMIVETDINYREQNGASL